MRHVNITIRRSNHRFVKENDIELSSLMRQAIAVANERDSLHTLPQRDGPRQGIDAKRTCISMELGQYQLMKKHDISPSRTADVLIDWYRKRMKGLVRDSETTDGNPSAVALTLGGNQS